MSRFININARIHRKQEPNAQIDSHVTNKAMKMTRRVRKRIARPFWCEL